MVARAVGAPAAEILDAALDAEEDLTRRSRAVHVASAQARAVAAGLVAAPVVSVPLLGRIMGVDLAAFYTTPVGIAILAVGVGLLALGVLSVVAMIRGVGRPTRRSGGRQGLLAAAVIGVVIGPLAGLLVGAAVWTVASRRHTQIPAEPGADEIPDLLATAMAGGCGPSLALRLVAEQLPAFQAALRREAFAIDVGATPTRSQDRAVADVVRLLDEARQLGAPLVPALRRQAAVMRADELSRVLADAERLPARMTFPTALCLLPATLLLIGAPIAHAGLSAVGA